MREPLTHCRNGHKYNARNSTTRHQRDKIVRQCLVCSRNSKRRSDFDGAIIGERVPEIIDPLKKGMKTPQECKKCGATGHHNFFHDLTDSMESFRCRQCGTEHYAYDAPPKSSKPGGKYSS